MSHHFGLTISLIGAGRVASSLAHALLAKGVKINEIYSRKLTHAQKLSNEIPDTTATDSLDFSKSHSDILIIAISDDAISQVSERILFPKDMLIAHTSGSVSLDILKHDQSGIFYPLQTFTNDKKVAFTDVPILIDGRNKWVIDQLAALGNLLSNRVKTTSEDERQRLHVAAVFASNFTNRMLAAASDILEETSIDLESLAPLVLESIQNAFESGPEKALTGPAKRGDVETVKKHLNLLIEKPALKEMYEMITRGITSKI
ncbi:Rossmann-like and DUF2520 domain-containing protein [Reichenbachiella sp.]|uniref:Rossmann-like and DUF2520 domain-containing protein n=1 Tax=Reichenbachiella sp. TaxID=2184521 RepID=UPI003B592C37